MQRGSFFVKEHIPANVSFMSYAQVEVCARKGRNWIQTIVHIWFYWKRHVFTIRVQTVGPVTHCMFDIVAATIGQQGRATGLPRPIHCCCCSQRKKSRGVKSGTTYCYDRVRADGTNRYIICVHWSMVSWFQCVARAPWYMRITQERHVCEYKFLHKKWSSLHGLSSLSFCRRGPVTPCIQNITKYFLTIVQTLQAKLLHC